MRILIVSDTHGRHENLKTVLAKEKPLDLLIHLGDIEGEEALISGMAGCPVEIIAGNNDFFSVLPREKELDIGDYHILITHGHYYYVGVGIEDIKREAKARDYDIVMFGHTHRPVIERGNDLTALNPGSISYPRQDGKQPSYILMEIGEDGKADFCIKYLEKR